MRAEIIAIGDELTSGQRLDTNSQWISRQLGDLGIQVSFHGTVGDDLQDCVSAIRSSAARADAIVITGGLGPTADDLTREALADALGRDLVLDEAALRHIEQLFSRRGRPMPDQNRVQAMFPVGSAVIPNPHGSAPGIHAQVPKEEANFSHVFALPGVPAEMREMWQETVEPALVELLGAGRKTIRHKCVKCFGVGESELEQMLPDLIRRGRQPAVGITVSRATITLRITAIGDSEEHCASLIGPTAETIHECLGDIVFGEDTDELQHAVVRQLRAAQKTLATAEYGPGGLMAQWLSDVDEPAICYRGGVIVRSDHTAEQVAAAATTARETHNADFGLAVGPFPMNVNHDISNPDDDARVVIALASVAPTRQQNVRFSGHPDILKSRCAKQALNLLRLEMLKK
jgi:nicotinamide-nucleotide amidase